MSSVIPKNAGWWYCGRCGQYGFGYAKTDMNKCDKDLREHTIECVRLRPVLPPMKKLIKQAQELGPRLRESWRLWYR